MPSKKSDLPAAIVATAREEASSLGVPKPSRAALLAISKSIVAAGCTIDAGLHTVPGVVAVVVDQGESRGWARGEVCMTVWVDPSSEDAEPDSIRDTARAWLGKQHTKVIVRVLAATKFQQALAALRWRRWRRKLSRVLDQHPKPLSDP